MRKKTEWDNIPEPMRPFVAHGCIFTLQESDQWCGTAPYDERDDKMYVNPKTGQFDNKVTGEKGNIITFLGNMAKHYEDQMSRVLLRKLAKNRGLPIEAFKGLHIGHDGGQNYMLPVFSHKGTVRDIRRWSPKIRKVMSTKSCKPQLYGMDVLAKAKAGTRVWICEGEWDRIAMRWWLKELGLNKDVAVGLPGALNFHESWLKFFEGMDVIDCHDNDEPGDKGATRVREMFFKANLPIRWLNWPDHWPDGWDVRDYVAHAVEHGKSLKKSFAKFESLVEDVHRRDTGDDEFSQRDPAEQIKFLSDDEAPTLKELLEVYSRYLEMDSEMTLALVFILSIVYSQQLGKKEPLWAYLVAAAGGGKTALLSCMGGCKRTIFRSTVTPNSLVSGFKSTSDPSLLPKLSGKTFIVKDFTTTLAGAEYDFEKVMAILRDAFDGDFQQSYGNDVHRNYENLHFSMVAGVTPMIHTKPQAMMGERFLKLCMRTGGTKRRMARLMATLRTVDQDEKMQKELSEVTERFLSRRVMEEDIPIPPQDYCERLAALSQLLSYLRAQVNRDRWDKDHLTHRPEAEVGTRPFKQFVKLSRALYVTLRKKQFDNDIYSVVERVCMDSCTGFNIEIVRCLMENGNSMTQSELSKHIDLSSSTVARQLKDLEVLKIVRKQLPDPKEVDENTGGRPPARWQVRKAMAHCWAVARVGQPYEPTSGKRTPVKGLRVAVRKARS